MELKFDTSIGEVEIRTAMFDIDGTTLEEGIEIKVDGELEFELYHYSLSDFEEMDEEEVRDWIEEKRENGFN